MHMTLRERLESGEVALYTHGTDNVTGSGAPYAHDTARTEHCAHGTARIKHNDTDMAVF